MKKLIAIIPTMCLLLLINSCEKDTELSKKDMLCNSTWKLSALTVDPSFPIFNSYDEIIGYTSDIYAQFDACDKDDTQKYNKDGSFIYDYKEKCDPTEPQAETGQWFLNADQTSITETSSDGEITIYSIIELKDKSLKYKYQKKYGTTTYTITATCVPSN